ncbi:MAB_1171c family putative transporter [Streptomyces sp. DSM 44917]|uniref:MAB_1171c family putative transporter n=1 Tax=Streptomyces boetiae TaxID=3075541 RepID=A0ABU2LG08_9ACTN|nr:MAB_1171c family putative transporter [Streptomyces sp. DSM 44917]MDT0310451.1 MAB_1171c family putative transporter [Streptomyces sp. DSM 44917]
MTVTEWANDIGRWSVVLMWAALIIRARPALKLHYQRGLWFAILTAATATTLFQPEVINRAVELTGDARAVTLSRNVVGVLAAGLTLLLIIDSARPRRARLFIAAATACATTTLVGMDLARGDYPGPGVPLNGGPAEPSTAYWLVVSVAHLVADLVIVLVCARYSARTEDRDLAWSLRLFAAGSLLAVVYWAGSLAQLYARAPDAAPWLAVVINLHGVSRALTLLVPTATRAVRLAREARTVWVLWPLWRDLSAAVPAVALGPPYRTRLHAFLRPRAPLALQAHRQTIETYDAILQLQAHLAPHAYERATQHAQELRLPAAQAAAAALAGALGQARNAKLSGGAATDPSPLPGLERGDAGLLLAVARHWPAMSRAASGHELTDARPEGDAA